MKQVLRYISYHEGTVSLHPSLEHMGKQCRPVIALCCKALFQWNVNGCICSVYFVRYIRVYHLIINLFEKLLDLCFM